MKQLLQPQLEVTKRSLSSLYEMLLLGSLSDIYVEKEDFDIEKIHQTFVSILRNEDNLKVYTLTRIQPKFGKTTYAVDGDEESENRIKDILELLNYVHVSAKAKRAINDLEHNLFSDLFTCSSDAMRVYEELAEQGTDPLSSTGKKEVSSFFWKYNLNLAIQDKIPS